MILLRLLQEIHDLLNLALAFMQASNICKFNIDVFHHLKLFLLRSHTLPASCLPLRSSDNSGNDEDDKEEVEYVIDLVE